MAELYVKVRDLFVNTFRLNPRMYLTFTACRRMITCDAGFAFRIHRFLCKWSLINYSCDPGTIPSGELRDIGATHYATKLGIRPVTDKSIEHLTSRATRFPTEMENPMIGDIESKRKCPISGNSFKQSAFKSKLNPEIVIDPKCHAKGFLLTMDQNSFDHIFIDSQKKYSCSTTFDSQSAWTNKDFTRLLKACKKFQSDWDSVAKFVGKPKEECIKEFAAYPLDDFGQCTKSFLPSNISALSDGSKEHMRAAAFLSAFVAPELGIFASQAAQRYALKPNDLLDEAKENLHNLARKVVSKELEKIQMVVKRLEKAFDLRRKERKENEQYRLALLKQRIELTQQSLILKKVLHKSKKVNRT